MTLPTTKLGEVEVTRLVVGGNPISGFSHGPRDKEMRDYFTTENVKKLLARCEKAGINTCFFRADKHVMRTLNEYWNDGGTMQWVAQSAPEIEVVGNVNQAVAFGAKAMYVHGGLVDACFESNDFDRMRRQIDRIHEHGIAAGCASHDPAHLMTLIEQDWDIDFFMVCLYNFEGYRGTLSVSQDEKFEDTDRAKALSIIKKIRQPCFAYKILAAGRKDPRESFTEVCSHIKPIDGINVGMYPPDRSDIVEANAALAEELLPR